MQRESLRIAVVAVLCILALSVAAATLDSASGGGGDGIVGSVVSWLPIPSPTAEERADPPQTGVVDPAAGGELGPLRQLFCIPALRDPAVQLAILAAVVGAVVGVVWRWGYLEAATTLTVLATPAVVFLFVFAFTMRGCTTEMVGLSEGEMTGGLGAGGAGEGTVSPFTLSPELLVVVAVAVAGVAAAVALLGSSGDDDPDGDASRAGERLVETAPMAAIASAAGAAADRIEASGAVDNEVYRAWQAMTEELDVPNPDASTPAEFREAAVNAGMDPEEVDALTALFEEVRYGGESVTDDRERRAVAALRRIESAYGRGRDRR